MVSVTVTKPSTRIPKRTLRRHPNRVYRITTVVTLLVLWQWVGLAHWVNPLFLSSPRATVEDFFKLAANGSLGHDAVRSGEEFVLGCLLAVVVSMPLGTAVGWYPKVSAMLQPFVSGLYSSPKVALLPLKIIFLGIGVVSKVVIVFLQAVFQIILNTAAGVRSAADSLFRPR
jgi:ABC-type nitrate/sulfonate/bicarbonate transport system permease component